MFDSLQEVEGEVPKRKEKSLLPEGKGRVIKCGKPTELYYCERRQRVKKDMGFGNGAPLEPLKCKLHEARLPPAPRPHPLLLKLGLGTKKTLIIFERMACFTGHENSRADSKDPGYPGYDVVECKMPTIVHSSHKEAECFPRSPFASGWKSALLWTMGHWRAPMDGACPLAALELCGHLNKPEVACGRIRRHVDTS